MSDHNPSINHDDSDEWFFPLEHLGKVGLAALVAGAIGAGGFAFGMAVLTLVIGLAIGGRIGTAIIGGLVGFMLGGSFIGLGLGAAIGVFNAWINEIESHRRGGNVIRQLGWLNGFIIGILMAGQIHASGVQMILAVGIYTFIGGFVAEVVPAFLNFLKSLDDDDEEEAV